MIGALLEWLGVALLAFGLLVCAVAVLGVIRLRGLYGRLHAAGKASALGVVAVLAASVGGGSVEIAARAALVAAFLLLTAPVAAHAIASAAYEAERREGEREPRS